jgi:hypothetical protein
MSFPPFEQYFTTSTYRRTVLLHGVRHLVVLVLSSLAGKEAVLAHVKVEALETAVPESLDGTGLADVALGLVQGRLGRHEAVQHGKPDHALRLLLHPVKKVKGLQVTRVERHLKRSR